MHKPAGPQRGRYRLHPPADVMTRRRVGEPNTRNGLEKPDGPFLLRDGLSGPGAMPLWQAYDIVCADWDRQLAAGTVSDLLIRDYKRKTRGLFSTAEQQGCVLVRDITTNLIWTWMRSADPRDPNAGPTFRTLSLRRSCARGFFITAHRLGITDVNPAKSIELTSKSERYVRPFTDDEIQILKQVSRFRVDETRMPAALALCLSGATANDVAMASVADVDLENKRMWLHDGGYRQRDRWVPLYDDWCVTAVQKRVSDLVATADVDGGEPGGELWLFYRAHATKPTPTRQGSAAQQRLSELLQKARVWEPGVTRLESIREWLALKVWESTGSVEEVACRLGMSSLDAAAHLVGYVWTDHHGIPDPPPSHRAKGMS